MLLSDLCLELMHLSFRFIGRNHKYSPLFTLEGFQEEKTTIYSAFELVTRREMFLGFLGVGFFVCLSWVFCFFFFFFIS